MVLGLLIIFSYGPGLVSAAGNTIYVNGSSGNDSLDGLTHETAKLSIKNAVNTVNTGGTIYVSTGIYSGTYNSDITIDHTMTIIGEGKDQTVINGLDSARIFTVNPGVTFNLKNLTISHAKSYQGSGVLNLGTTNIEGCKFTNCYTTYFMLCGGAAICNEFEATLNVKNSDFINNNADLSMSSGGGAIMAEGTTTLENCNFIGNSAYWGGAISVFDDANININGCSFINNKAINSGGAMAIYTDKSTVNIHFSSFTGNSAYPSSTNNIDNRYQSPLNVTSNWWGSNDGVTGIGGPYTADNWIYMTLDVNPTVVHAGKTRKVTANFNHLYNGSGIMDIDPANGHIPDGTIVNFSTDLGTINPNQNGTVNGITTTTYYSSIVGLANIIATSDNQQLSKTITVNLIPTNLTVNNANGKNGEKVNLKARLKDEDYNPLGGKRIIFSINGTTIGSATTDNTGTAVLNYRLVNSGIFIISAEFAGDSRYAKNTGSGSLNVAPVADLYFKATSNNKNPKVGDNFTITYKLGNYGPDTADNVVINFQIPEGLQFVSISADCGKWIYDPLTKTVTWTLDRVNIGDPYLYLTVKALKAGSYIIDTKITSNTTINISNSANIIINVQNASNNSNTTNNTINIPNTGTPVYYLIVAIFMIIGGLVLRK